MQVMHNGVLVDVDDKRGQRAEPKRASQNPSPEVERDHSEWLYCRGVLERWMEWERRENVHVPTSHELNDIFAESGIYDGS